MGNWNKNEEIPCKKLQGKYGFYNFSTSPYNAHWEVGFKLSFV